MPCDVCSNLFHCLRKIACKIFCSRETQLVNDKEITIDLRRNEGKSGSTQNIDNPSVANVAACGDVKTNFPRPSDVLGSEVDDFDSWNEEVDVLQLESEAATVSKGDHSCYTTAELDEAIFEDNPNRTESLRMSRQSEKDVDSITEFFDNSGYYMDGMDKYLDLPPGPAEQDEVRTLTSEFAPEAGPCKDDRQTNFRIMMNISEPSSVTTATAAAAFDSSDIDDSVNRSLYPALEVTASPSEERSNIPDDSIDSFVRTLTQVTNDESPSKFSHSEEAGRQAEWEEEDDDDQILTESQSTQTESASAKQAPGRPPKKWVWTKRRTRSLARWFAADSGGAGKARVRFPPVGGAARLPASFSLFAFLRNGCCRGLRPTPVLAMTTANRRKRQRRPLSLDLATGNLLKKKQWPPTNSLINTTLCGSFRLVEQPKMAPRRHDYRQSPAIAIPFLFGIQSTNVVPTKTGGAEKAAPKDENENVSGSSESCKSTQSSSKVNPDEKSTDPK